MTEYTGFTDDQIDELPADSPAGRERDLADMLSQDTLDWYYTALEFTDDTELESAIGYGLFLQLMMHEKARQAMVDDPAELETLIAQIQDDAWDGSAAVFIQRMNQRLAHYRTLIRMTAEYRREQTIHEIRN